MRRQACARKKGRRNGVKEQCTAHTIVLVMAEGAREGLIQDVNVITDAWIPTRSINPLLFNHKGNLGDRAGFNVSLCIRRRCALNCTSRFYSGRRRVARPFDQSRRFFNDRCNRVTFHAACRAVKKREKKNRQKRDLK